MNIVDEAMDFAIEAHWGVRNKYDDEPYIFHVLRVWRAVRDDGLSDITQAVALLHDTIEDNDAVTYSVILEKFGQSIANAVDVLSKKKGESNKDYYAKIRENPWAAEVKRRDIKDNFSRNHLIVDDETRLRMAFKYSLGMDILK